MWNLGIRNSYTLEVCWQFLWNVCHAEININSLFWDLVARFRPPSVDQHWARRLVTISQYPIMKRWVIIYVTPCLITVIRICQRLGIKHNPLLLTINIAHWKVAHPKLVWYTPGIRKVVTGSLHDCYKSQYQATCRMSSQALFQICWQIAISCYQVGNVFFIVRPCYFSSCSNNLISISHSAIKSWVTTLGISNRLNNLIVTITINITTCFVSVVG